MLSASRAPSPLMFIPPQVSISTTPDFNLDRYARQLQVMSFQTQVDGPTRSPLEVHLDKIRIAEALTARDVAVHRLEGACASIRTKQMTIERLEHEKEELELSLALKGSAIDGGKDGGEFLGKQRKKHEADIERLEALNRALKEEIEALQTKQKSEMALVKSPEMTKNFPFVEDDSDKSIHVKSPVPADGITLPGGTGTDTEGFNTVVLQEGISGPNDIEAKSQTRNAILAALPIPSDMPTDILVPITVPSPYSIHDFLGTASGALKTQLSNYRVFQECTTAWCTEREEHGYFLTPVYKCATNPRVSTAHRWMPANISARMNKPMECFYQKEGKWYYAGVYRSFRLDDLSVHEWGNLSNEASQSVIKETLAGRKNTSPQNVYETGQLYAAGALKVACIGLQCIGFNTSLYKGLLEQAELCLKTGRWRGGVVAGSTGPGLGNNGASWNVHANTNVVGMSGVTLVVQMTEVGDGNEREVLATKVE